MELARPWKHLCGLVICMGGRCRRISGLTTRREDEDLRSELAVITDVLKEVSIRMGIAENYACLQRA